MQGDLARSTTPGHGRAWRVLGGGRPWCVVVMAALDHDPEAAAAPCQRLLWTAIRPALLTAQICSMGLFSLASTATRLPSWHTAYAVLFSAFVLCIGAIHSVEFFQTPDKRRNRFKFISAVPTYLESVALVLLWVRVAGRWPGLWARVNALESRLWAPEVHRLPRLHRRARHVSCVFALVASLQQPSLTWRRLPVRGLFEGFQLILSLGFTSVFDFNAMLLIVLSGVPAECFRALTDTLRSAAEQGGNRLPSEAVEGVRVLYNEVCRLTLAVDATLGPIFLVTIFADGLYICRFILFLLTGSVQSWYACATVTVTASRFVYTILAASSVHTEWLATRACLHRVVPCRGGNEVARIFMQIGSDRIALTALGIMTITKSLLPAVLGAILSYEIILVQFHLQMIGHGFSNHSTAYS
ncbi:gustatory receptor 5a for trehalose-like isoform X2 [Frankliniella occidentalis]|uniref:Gustatory receptor 5a for trehalose-like isoform X2 n=1 Tax=Frankliniella occidentalis TaxID=133901 RepID=A0A9C6XAI6_FRAOC|nr:gustatory receptor 5a for trehalose-like isoform X2 [Frankliniella occidentalis]